jgi:hypothetical protein
MRSFGRVLRRILQNGFELGMMRRTWWSPYSKREMRFSNYSRMLLVSSFNEMEIENTIEPCPSEETPWTSSIL